MQQENHVEWSTDAKRGDRGELIGMCILIVENRVDLKGLIGFKETPCRSPQLADSFTLLHFTLDVAPTIALMVNTTWLMPFE